MSAEIAVLPPFDPMDKDEGRDLVPLPAEQASSDDHMVELWLHG